MNCYKKAVSELEALDFVELRAAIVTHTHLDHFGGVIDVLEELQERFTGTLFFNHDSFLAMPGTDDNKRNLRGLLTRALEFDDRVGRAHSDVEPLVLGSTRITLLAPSYAQLLRAVAAGQPNLASGIVLIESEDKSMIIGGDAQLDAWRLAASRLPRDSIARWPHHGGSISRSEGAQAELLQLLQPSAVLVSVGASNNHSHPSDEFFDAVVAHGSKLLCTQATTKCTANDSGEVCAGSIRIDLTAGGSPQPMPSRTDHDEFIRLLGSAQCINARS